jgi:hypothetical protein
MTKFYYGTNRVSAWPETGKDGRAGYTVRYADGFTSWSPKEVFEEEHQSEESMSFGHALQALKNGERVARLGWDGKGTFLFLVPGSRFAVSRPPLLGIFEAGTEIEYHSHIDMKTAQGYVVPWLASQADLLAWDWHVFES